MTRLLTGAWMAQVMVSDDGSVLFGTADFP
jgi:hypothetical protein